MKHLVIIATLLLSPMVFADNIQITINKEVYTCSKTGGSAIGSSDCACRRKDNSYTVFYFNGEEWSDIGKSKYSNVADCARAMNGSSEFQHICN